MGMFFTGTTLRTSALGPNITATAAGSANIVDDVGGDNVLVGGASSDSITANAGNDRLAGGAGNDQLIAGAGNDTLVGGAGVDQLWGGTGADLFLFDVGPGADQIFDFNEAEGDKVLGTDFRLHGDADGYSFLGNNAAKPSDWLVQFTATFDGTWTNVNVYRPDMDVVADATFKVMGQHAMGYDSFLV